MLTFVVKYKKEKKVIPIHENETVYIEDNDLEEAVLKEEAKQNN